MTIDTRHVTPPHKGAVLNDPSPASANQDMGRTTLQPASISAVCAPWHSQSPQAGGQRETRSEKSTPPPYDPAATYKHGDTVAINGRLYTLIIAPGARPVKGIPPEGKGALTDLNSPWWYSGSLKSYPVPPTETPPSSANHIPSTPSAPVPKPSKLPSVKPPGAPNTGASHPSNWTYDPGNPSITSIRASHPQMYSHSQAVFKIEGHGLAGTGFRLGPNNLFMTNAHVIRSDPKQAKYELIAGFEDDPSNPGAQKPVTVRIDKVLFRSDRYGSGKGAGMDVVIFSIDPADYRRGILDRFGYLGIDPSPLKSNQQIYMPNHAKGAPKQIAFLGQTGEPTKIVSPWTGYFTTDVQEAGGASGAPVMDTSTHQVVGINHTGMNGDTRGGAGTSMHRLFPYIAHLFPGAKPPQGSPPPSQP